MTQVESHHGANQSKPVKERKLFIVTVCGHLCQGVVSVWIQLDYIYWRLHSLRLLHYFDARATCSPTALRIKSTIVLQVCLQLSSWR